LPLRGIRGGPDNGSIASATRAFLLIGRCYVPILANTRTATSLQKGE
jgi:hypothetical protein